MQIVGLTCKRVCRHQLFAFAFNGKNFVIPCNSFKIPLEVLLFNVFRDINFFLLNFLLVFFFACNFFTCFYLRKDFYLCFRNCYQGRGWTYVKIFSESEISCVRAWHIMCFRENNNGGSKRVYTATNMVHLQHPALAITYRISRNAHISTTTVPMATKICRMGTYFKGLLVIKSRASLIK